MLNITKDRQTDYVIIRKTNASKSLEKSISELRDYLFKITGTLLGDYPDTKKESKKEIVIGYTNRIFISNDEKKELGKEGFIIKTTDEKIYIIGSEVRGALYGVYTFLEKYCGCRFYTDSFEKIPTIKELSIPSYINDKEIPVFEYRNAFWYSLLNESICAKLKINGEEPRKISEDYGGGILYSGKSERNATGFVHTIGYLTERCKEGQTDYSQPCLTDEKTYKTILKNVEDQISRYPDAQIISISQNDGNIGACQCEKCKEINEREGTDMGTMLLLVNRIATELKDKYPNILFDTIAYRFTRRPPENIKPVGNVIVRLCSIECCFRHPLNECSETPGHEEKIDNFADNLRDWSKITNHLYIWDYTTNFTNYTQPYANFDVLLKNIRFFADNNVKGVFEQGNIHAPNGEFGELKAYLISKALWNPYMTEKDFHNLRNEFLDDYYGAGGKYIGEYIDMMLETSFDSHFGIYYDNPGLYQYCRDTDSHLEGEIEFAKKGIDLFDKAEKASFDDNVFYAHIKRSRIQLYNYIDFLYRDIIDDLKAKDSSSELIKEYNNKIIENNKLLFNELKKYGIKSTMEFVWMNDVSEPDYSVPALLWKNQNDKN